MSFIADTSNFIYSCNKNFTKTYFHSLKFFNTRMLLFLASFFYSNCNNKFYLRFSRYQSKHSLLETFFETSMIKDN